MNKKLVIVESPAKAKTIGRYLGSEYKITASVGHIRDLPASTIGVNVKDNFKPTYINMRGKEKVIKELKELAKDTEEILIATDPDREGEAIAWHIANVLKVDPLSNCRITFNEITLKAVQNAIKEPRTIDLDLVNAQQARRILDRLVGYELSPLLWKKIRKGLSAGRVQSVTTKIIVDREKEIKDFIPEEYWLLTANVTPQKIDFPFTVRYQGTKGKGDTKTSKVKLITQEQTELIIKELAGAKYIVDTVKKGHKQRQPFPPFTTSTLQQDASKKLGFSSRKTMSVAQQLYEGVEIQGQGQIALVSYIRTDSMRVSEEASEEAKSLILHKFGAEYLPKTPKIYKNKNSSQDAHEAIRPAHFDLNPDAIFGSLSRDQYRLYKLIWDRFLASQMTNALLDTVTLDIKANNHIFRTQGEVITFPGFLAAYADIVEEAPEENDPTASAGNLSVTIQDPKSEAFSKAKETSGEENTKTKPDKIRLPDLTVGEELNLLKLFPEQKFTTPPSRYTEASLIKYLEEQGIGRPSTYAPTISTILERNYIEKQGKSLAPTELGEIVTKMLVENFSGIVDPTFTASMEGRLDHIEIGEKNWIEVLSDFYPEFHAQVEKALVDVEKIQAVEEKTGEKCPECENGELIIKQGRYGKFIACSNFPECKYTNNIQIPAPGHCPICGSGLAALKSKKFRNRIFYVCDKKGSDPECKFISWDLPVEGESCPECNSFMVWKKARGSSYKKCGNAQCSTNQKKKEDKKTKEEV